MSVLEAQRAVLHEPIPLDQLHGLIRLLAARAVLLQHAANARRINRLQLRFCDAVAVTQQARRCQRNQIRFHLFQEIGRIFQSRIEIAAIGSLVDAEIVANLMPQRAIETALRRQIVRLRCNHRRLIGAVGFLEEFVVQ